MGPIEIMFLVLWGVFGIVGWVRGFFKELGITLIIIAALIAVYLIDARISDRLPDWLELPLYAGILIFGVLVAYQGQTISFQGKDPPGFEGDVWGILIGLLNGWLVIGTLWYYIHRYNYPFIKITPPLSGLALQLIGYLPFTLIPTSWLQYVLIGALLFLLLLRVIR